MTRLAGPARKRTSRVCSYTGCSIPHDSKGYCSTHNSRIRLYGDPHGKRCETCNRPLQEVFKTVRTQSYCGDGCRPVCGMYGCGKVVRKMSYCEIHYNQLRRHGTLSPRKHEWTAPGTPCHYCGGDVPEDARKRKYCTSACEQLFRRHGRSRPTERDCGSCGTPFNLLVRTKSGALRRHDTKMCEKCRAKKRKYGMTVFELALRDGVNCTICSEDIDMTLMRPKSLFGPSIDHVKPRSRGGTNDPENLALAHYWCNAVKSDREDFTI